MHKNARMLHKYAMAVNGENGRANQKIFHGAHGVHGDECLEESLGVG